MSRSIMLLLSFALVTCVALAQDSSPPQRSVAPQAEPQPEEVKEMLSIIIKKIDTLDQRLSRIEQALSGGAKNSEPSIKSSAIERAMRLDAIQRERNQIRDIEGGLKALPPIQSPILRD